MADLDTLFPEPPPSPGTPAPAAPLAPQVAYRDALKRYDGALLAEIAAALGQTDPPSGRVTLAAWIADHLAQPRAAERLLTTLPQASRLATTLFALTESASWPREAMTNALLALGVDPFSALQPLLDLGMIAVAPRDSATLRNASSALDPATAPGSTILAHASVVASSRTVLPVAAPAALSLAGEVKQIREADGLEPILRLAVVWQRVEEAPLRQTQQGTLYKRDRDRLEDDPAIAGPITDSLEPLPDMPALWLALALAVGLLESEHGSERLSAATPEFWTDNAYHLTQMIAARWLALRSWHEQGGIQREGAVLDLALPFMRPVVLLWLATLAESDWITTVSLDASLRDRFPQWDRPTLTPITPPEPIPQFAPRNRTLKPLAKNESASEPSPLEAMLLGAAYQLGLVRVAQEVDTQQHAVQITPLGRYLLAIGPPPPPKPTYEHFLFVQPSFEIIAYRQGLTPSIVGQFSRFAIWSQVSAALALRLTPESVYRGLEGGLSPQAMLDILARHSSRPLPAGVAEALRTWAGRRERITYHAAATLVEFASPEDLERALLLFPESLTVPPVRVSDRLLLVENESSIPFERFRMTGARDYRRPPEVCVEVAPDGIILTLDLARSDLLVDAELARFSDEETSPSDRPSPTGPRRRFKVSSESLARAHEAGMTPTQLTHWYERRTGGEIPPAVRLLLAARSSQITPLTTHRPLILKVPTSEILDGLTQHPDTRDLLGERLGPTSIIIPEPALAPFRIALHRLGLILDPEPTRPKPRTST